MTLRLLQIEAEGGRRVVAAQGGESRLVAGAGSVRDMAMAAIAAGQTLADRVAELGYDGMVDIEAAYAQGRILSPIEHADPAHLILSGTGLTHLGSAEGRDQMHREMLAAATQTDSMRMFLEGLEGGKPAAGDVGQQPEWFYKGDGSQLVAPGGPITMPHFARDGGEEPELAGVYLIGPDGEPYRLGFCLGNEFS
ncbi:MAG: hypothetical protein JWM33_3936, partial [Caulobacteraceae bacterium]|nr:hypothetical protein [Caulobacteraceae bacterium]